MNRSQKIILFKGAVETLEYFSEQIAKTLGEAGWEVLLFDMKKRRESMEQMCCFIGGEKVSLLTFNFIALSGEEEFLQENGKSIWENMEMDCYCIMVDHPMYYFKQLSRKQKNLRLICIDRDHCKFVEDFYPFYGKTEFLPLAGTCLGEELLSWKERDIDVIFAGNYVPLERLVKYLDGVEEENKQFYFEIIQELINYPHRTMEEVIIKHLKREVLDISDEEILACMHSMIFVDLYVRSFFRREIVCAVAESGLKVTVLGKDWEYAKCKKPENLIQIGQVDSKTCLEYMRRSKISLNIMPWFKNGSHDRIFNSLLAGCICVTDSSVYMDEILIDNVNSIKYTLKERKSIPKKMKMILENREDEDKIVREGFLTAKREHTWEKRTEKIIKIIEK